jgi:isoleucyl-tRNA synthetase
VQQVIAAAKAGDWSVDGENVISGGVALQSGEYTLELELDDPAAAVMFLAGTGFVLLDTNVTPELAAEGLARDVIRAVQQARKDADLDVSDRITLTLGSNDAATRAAIETHRQLISGETLATTLNVGQAGDGEALSVGEGASVMISVVCA